MDGLRRLVQSERGSFERRRGHLTNDGNESDHMRRDSGDCGDNLESKLGHFGASLLDPLASLLEPLFHLPSGGLETFLDFSPRGLETLLYLLSSSLEAFLDFSPRGLEALFYLPSGGLEAFLDLSTKIFEEVCKAVSPLEDNDIRSVISPGTLQ